MGNQNETRPFIFAMAILRYDIGMTSESLLSQKRGFYSFKKVVWVKVTQYLKSDLKSLFAFTLHPHCHLRVHNLQQIGEVALSCVLQQIGEKGFLHQDHSSL